MSLTRHDARVEERKWVKQQWVLERQLEDVELISIEWGNLRVLLWDTRSKSLEAEHARRQDRRHEILCYLCMISFHGTSKSRGQKYFEARSGVEINWTSCETRIPKAEQLRGNGG